MRMLCNINHIQSNDDLLGPLLMNISRPSFHDDDDEGGGGGEE